MNGMDVRTLRVELGDRSYPIHIGPALLSRHPELLFDAVRGSQALVLSDANVAPLYLSLRLPRLMYLVDFW